MVVSNVLRKKLFCFSNVENSAEPGVNLVNDVGGEAGNVFFEFVGGYL